jgi:hypothetical protein
LSPIPYLFIQKETKAPSLFLSLRLGIKFGRVVSFLSQKTKKTMKELGEKSSRPGNDSTGSYHDPHDTKVSRFYLLFFRLIQLLSGQSRAKGQIEANDALRFYF